jgi:methylenetetrahydrofolate reductase (NADPH)
VTTSAAERVRELAAAASIEITPKHAERLRELGALLPAGTPVYVTALPGADPADLVRGAVHVREAGHHPVPHISARSIAGPEELDALLGRLVADAGVDDVLVIAGGVKTPAGAYTSSMDVLESGVLERHGIRRVGVAGHPEGSPDIPAEAEREALAAKNAFAERSQLELRIVTQFALAAEPYVDYERRIREQGNTLPVIAGLPGVTSPPTLIKYGLACGIGPSLEVLRKQSGGLLKLATTRLWKPDEIAHAVAESTIADAGSRIAGFHMFPFGGIQRTAEWLAEQRAAAPLPA